jgi:ClpP class serine protease
MSGMSFDFSSLLWVLFLIMALQPVLMGRWYTVRRAQAIRAIEKAHGTRVITMIHRQEKRSLFGFSVSRHIDLEDAQTIIAAIKETPPDIPIDLILHTPGGLVLAAMQIARAVEAHKAKVTVYVPVYAMSGGTLIALAADEIVLGEFSVLGPIDPQIAGLPAASIVKARDSKPIAEVFDLTLVLADVSEKALAQVRRGAVELLTPRMELSAAEALAAKLAGGALDARLRANRQRSRNAGPDHLAPRALADHDLRLAHGHADYRRSRLVAAAAGRAAGAPPARGRGHPCGGRGPRRHS